MFDLDGLTASSGFVGVEIEQSVVDAMHLAYEDKTTPRREFTTDDIDLGFTRDAGHYVFAGDWYGIKDIKQDYLTQALAQRYA